MTACPRHQLATPDECRACVAGRPQLSGPLHKVERELAGFGTDHYDRALRNAFSEAEAVLVVNPIIAAMVSPYARQVHVVPSGFDSARFDFVEFSSEQTEVSADYQHPIRLFSRGFAGNT